VGQRRWRAKVGVFKWLDGDKVSLHVERAWF
jgi:hypothetical protein